MNATQGLILVVDDYENWRALSRSILEEDGHMVEVSSSYEEAIGQLSKSVFDVVILDMRLVDDQKYNVQGLALLYRVKNQTPPAGAVILTGYSTEVSKERALNMYGADAYVDKVPEDGDFDIEGFLLLVRRLVQSRRNLGC